MKTTSKVKIESIQIQQIPDDFPDTSYLGKYTDDLEPGVIVRQYDEFYNKLTEEQIDNLEGRGREYRYFKPYAGGEPIYSEDYYKYGRQDYERMEGLSHGDWYFIGMVAQATVSYPIGGGSRRLEHFTSAGLFGIESDAGPEYIHEIAVEQIEDLKYHLEEFGIDTKGIYEIAMRDNPDVF